MLCLRFLGLNMKLIANDIYLNYLPGGKVAVSFVVDNPKIANIVVADMKGKNIELQIKEHKSKRSIEQNNLLWAIIENISLKLNGNRADENYGKFTAIFWHQTLNESYMVYRKRSRYLKGHLGRLFRQVKR